MCSASVVHQQHFGEEPITDGMPLFPSSLSKGTFVSGAVEAQTLAMDEIFEQMLSTSPWGDGIGMNRATWDGAATGSASNMTIDSAVELQALHKVSTMPLMPLVGGLGSQGLTRALQEGSGTLSPDGIFNTGQGHGVHGAHQLQPMAPAWYVGGVPPAPTGLGPGKLDAFPLQGDAVPHDSHLGKRVRDEDCMSLDGLSARSMAHVTASQGVQTVQSYGDQGTLAHDPTGAAANGAVRPRVRARRGQATDPHSIAERNRRERIAERMKALQELVPDSNKTDKASMLDEIIGYVKFLQMQVKCLSMCRLGGAGAAAPLLADLPAEGTSNFLAANLAQASAGSGNSQEGMAFAERQVARLMDEDMSAAMQYLQSKGLCLMPISLATAISSTGSRQPTKGAEVVGNMKQAMELQATAVAAAAAAAAVAGDGTASMMASLGCNPMGQDGGGTKPSVNVARALMEDLQRDDKINEKAPLPANKYN